MLQIFRGAISVKDFFWRSLIQYAIGVSIPCFRMKAITKFLSTALYLPPFLLKSANQSPSCLQERFYRLVTLDDESNH
ncbi:MAG: hypothetical protein EA409_01855 [Saprospirales bacterium]|nr:MAG: hypothetical protein EA409_01855 [Saprospirales bacterium]